jgi:hypothetical protein
MKPMSNSKKKSSKIPRIKIPPQDLKSFLIDSLEIDPFWYDLYGIKEQKD